MDDRESETRESPGPSKLPEDGRQIGPYLLRRVLGEGGMGIVYEAEQQDPRRPVALKVMRGGRLASEREVALFRREERTLARLRHPGIASIYEAGLTEDGQHYFVMELVRGVPLQDYLRDQPIDREPTRGQLEPLLRLFLQICDAVNYAHQKGVLHRDLKPSNIFVTAEAATGASLPGSPAVQVKVLDFGLARITEADADASTVLTEHGLIQGTLTYMSPEQARGDADHIDVRSDVYALGVVLYEMLTGRMPYAVRNLPLHEAVRAICFDSPARPATIAPWLRGDLDAILQKALEKEPTRRYQNVLMLADDLHRHLDDRPIQARPPTMAYQLRKLVSRHRTAFAFTAVLLLLLVGFAATMSVLYEMQRRARLRADSEAHKAAEINRFLQGMLASVDPDQAQGREVTVREVLDAAATRVQTGFADQPDVGAALHNTIGVTYRALGAYDAAERHLEAALSSRRTLYGEQSEDFAVGIDELAQLRHATGDFAAAESLGRLAVGIDRQRQPRGGPELAASLNTLGVVLQAEGKYQEADSLLRTALEMRRRLLGAEREEVATSLSNLASLLQDRGDLVGAEANCREALEMRRRLLGLRHPDTVASLNNLAVLLLKQGRLTEAEACMREAWEAARLVFGAEHPNAVRCLNNLAEVVQMQGRLTEAEPLYREALAVGTRAFGPRHPAVAAGLNNLASLLMAEEKYNEAESLYRETLSMRRAIYGEEHPAVATGLQNLAILRQTMGRPQEAEALFRQALAMRRRLLGEEHPDVASTLLGLGSALVDQRRAREGEPLLRRALAIRTSSASANPWQVAVAQGLLGACLTSLHRCAEAESLLARSGPLILASSRATPRQRQEALRRMAELYEAWGRPDSAAAYQRRWNSLSRPPSVAPVP